MTFGRLYGRQVWMNWKTFYDFHISFVYNDYNHLLLSFFPLLGLSSSLIEKLRDLQDLDLLRSLLLLPLSGDLLQ